MSWIEAQKGSPGNANSQRKSICFRWVLQLHKCRSFLSSKTRCCIKKKKSSHLLWASTVHYCGGDWPEALTTIHTPSNVIVSDSLFCFCSTGPHIWLLLSSILWPAVQQASIQELALLNTLLMVRVVAQNQQQPSTTINMEDYQLKGLKSQTPEA